MQLIVWVHKQGSVVSSYMRYKGTGMCQLLWPNWSIWCKRIHAINHGRDLMGTSPMVSRSKVANLVEFVHSLAVVNVSLMMSVMFLVVMTMMMLLLDVHWHGHFHLLNDGHLLDDMHRNMHRLVDDSSLAGHSLPRARNEADEQKRGQCHQQH